MSGSNVGRSPQTDQEWVRDIQRRVVALERKQTWRIGDFVIAARGGELVVSAPGREPIVLTSAPVETEQGAIVPRIQRLVTIIGSPSGGTFTLIYRGATTTPLNYNESAGDVRDALIALSPRYTVLDFDVTGANGGPWTVTFPQGSLSADAALLTGGTSPGVLITTAT